jgi:ribosome-interacting GTPase 1
MPINAGFEYQKLEKEYANADTISDKLRVLQQMLQASPSHKGAENLRNDLKQRIAKYKKILEKEKQSKKGSRGFSIKKEGAAQIVILGKTNVGKSTLLSKITNAKPLIADYKFTTTRPEIGTLNYKGIILQVVEIPAITKNYLDKENGPAFMGIVRGSDLVVILYKDEKELLLIKSELKESEIKNKIVKVLRTENQEKSIKKIWKNLNLIYVYTKSPGKEKDNPPVALKKKSTVRALTLKVHKDFFKNFDYARIWGPSAKHLGMRVGLGHVLKEEDVIELHIK